MKEAGEADAALDDVLMVMIWDDGKRQYDCSYSEHSTALKLPAQQLV